jgi:hypothetical protein
MGVAHLRRSACRQRQANLFRRPTKPSRRVAEALGCEDREVLGPRIALIVEDYANASARASPGSDGRWAPPVSSAPARPALRRFWVQYVAGTGARAGNRSDMDASLRRIRPVFHQEGS